MYLKYIQIVNYKNLRKTRFEFGNDDAADEMIRIANMGDTKDKERNTGIVSEFSDYKEKASNG